MSFWKKLFRKSAPQRAMHDEPSSRSSSDAGVDPAFAALVKATSASMKMDPTTGNFVAKTRDVEAKLVEARLDEERRAKQDPSRAGELRLNADVTPLMEAAHNGRLEYVRTLLEGGADVNAKTKRASTALIFASQHGHSEVVRALLAKGADMSAKTDDGATALLWASMNGRSDVVKVLLEAGADVNVVNNSGATPLMGACANGHREAAQLLLGKSARVNDKMNDGASALSLAQNADIKALLVQAGATA